LNYKELRSRNAVFAAMRECDILKRKAFLQKYGFQASRKYVVLHEGKEYDSKPLLAAAYGIRFPERGPLSNDFGGGKEAAGRYLIRLGFDVAGLSPKERDWSLDEVERVVSGYFSLLDRHLEGQTFVKSKEVATIAQDLTQRNEAAVLRKFGNISSILQRYGHPWIAGFTPQANVQTLLEAVIFDQIEQVEPHALQKATAGSDPDAIEYEIEISPPVGIEFPDVSGSFTGKKIDFDRRSKNQRKLGMAGEKWAFEYLKKRYSDRHEIIWSSKEVGDGLGYDIEVISSEGNSTYYEIKTTSGDAHMPFHISANEVAASELYRQRYRIMRVFDFLRWPRFYMLKGPVRECCHLRETAFVAVPS